MCIIGSSATSGRFASSPLVGTRSSELAFRPPSVGAVEAESVTTHVARPERSGARRITIGLVSTTLALLAALPTCAEDGLIGPPACGYKVEYWVAPNCGGVGVMSWATAVNDAGVAVGYYEGCPSPDASRAFVWYPDGSVQTIDLPWSISERAQAINNHNQVALDVIGLDPAVKYGPVLWQEGEIVEVFDIPEWATKAHAQGINDDGVIVAEYGNYVTGPAPLAGVWSIASGFVDLTPVIGGFMSHPRGITDDGRVTGTAFTSERQPVQAHYRAFLLDGDDLTLLDPVPGCVNSIAKGVSSAGHVVGYGYTSLYVKGRSDTHPWIGFLWHDGEMTVLPPLPLEGHDETNPASVNAHSVAVGRSNSSGPGVGARVAVWFRGTAHELGSLSSTPPGGSVGSGSAISDTGIIVGRGGFQGYPRAMRLTPVLRPLGDLDQNCQVDGGDLSVLLAVWGQTRVAVDDAIHADLNSDGMVDGEDLGLLIGSWSAP